MKILAAGRGGRAEFAWADAGIAMGWITDSSFVTLPVQRCFPTKIEADLMEHSIVANIGIGFGPKLIYLLTWVC